MTDHPTFTPDEIKQAQRKLGLSDIVFAPMLGCSVVQLRRLKVKKPGAASARTITPATARLLRAYLDGYRPDDWPG